MKTKVLVLLSLLIGLTLFAPGTANAGELTTITRTVEKGEAVKVHVRTASGVGAWCYVEAFQPIFTDPSHAYIRSSATVSQCTSAVANNRIGASILYWVNSGGWANVTATWSGWYDNLGGNYYPVTAKSNTKYCQNSTVRQFAGQAAFSLTDVYGRYTGIQYLQSSTKSMACGGGLA